MARKKEGIGLLMYAEGDIKKAEGFRREYLSEEVTESARESSSRNFLRAVNAAAGSCRRAGIDVGANAECARDAVLLYGKIREVLAV